MSDKNDGGPAFPAPVEVKTDWTLKDVTSGMSLRDYFAGQALAGYCAVEATWDDVSPEDLARACYRTADAMLAERSK